MAELTPQEKLQPCLLDRLTDNDPKKNKESRNKRVVSLQKYKKAVMRDLSWLLNTHANSEQSGYDAFEEIPSSVLNFGVQNVAGKTASSLNIDDMQFQLKETLCRFEPRILPDTISIDFALEPDAMKKSRSLSFEIRGVLWSQPLPESLFIKTELDLETGKSSINWGISG
ncbi:MAG: type VI secretion system baseplate subunit TssE [Desulfobacteraceae bacterium]